MRRWTIGLVVWLAVGVAGAALFRYYDLTRVENPAVYRQFEDNDEIPRKVKVDHAFRNSVVPFGVSLWLLGGAAMTIFTLKSFRKEIN